MAFLLLDSDDKDKESLGNELFAKLDIFANDNHSIEWNVDENIAYMLLNKNTIKAFISSQIIEKTIHKYAAFESCELNETIMCCIIKVLELMDEKHILHFANLPHLFDGLLCQNKIYRYSFTLSFIKRFLSSNALPYYHKQSICKWMHKHDFFNTHYRISKDHLSPELKTVGAKYRSIMMENIFGSWSLLQGYFREMGKEINMVCDVIVVIHKFISYLYQPHHICIGAKVYYNNNIETVLDTTVLDIKKLYINQQKRQSAIQLQMKGVQNMFMPQIDLKTMATKYLNLPKKFVINDLCALLPFSMEPNMRIANIITDELMQNHDAIFDCSLNMKNDFVLLQLCNNIDGISNKVVNACEIEKVDFKVWKETQPQIAQIAEYDAIVIFGEWKGRRVKVQQLLWNDHFAVIERHGTHATGVILLDFLCPAETNMILHESTSEIVSSSAIGGGLFDDDSSTDSSSS